MASGTVCSSMPSIKASSFNCLTVCLLRLMTDEDGHACCLNANKQRWTRPRLTSRSGTRGLAAVSLQPDVELLYCTAVDASGSAHSTLFPAVNQADGLTLA